MNGATFGTKRAIVTILNDDNPPKVIVDGVTVTEGDEGATDAVLSVGLEGATVMPVSMDYATVDGSALVGRDYLGGNGVIRWASINVPGGALHLKTHQASDRVLRLSWPAAADGAELEETDSLNGGWKKSGITVAETASEKTALVDLRSSDTRFFRLAQRAAGAGSASGVLDVQIIRIPIVGDRIPEPTETFTVRFSNVKGATPASLEAVVTIFDNDLPALAISGVSVVEGNSGVTTAAFVVRLSSPSSQTVTIDYATSDRNALAGSDYRSESGTLTFAPGDTTNTIFVGVFGDAIPEPDETFAVTLSNPVNAALAVAEAIGIIGNDDVVEPGENKPPLVRITTPENDDTFPSDTSIIIAADASDPDGAVVSVEFFATASSGTKTSIGSITKAPFILAWLNVAQGDYSLTARATDNKGAVGESVPVRISVKPDNGRRRVAIVQNFPDAEISKLQAWVRDMDLSSRVFDQEGLTFEALADYDLVIWDDLGSPGLTGNDVSIFQQLHAADIPLYLIGDDLVQVTDLLPVPQQSVWRNLLHLKAGGLFITGERVSFLKEHKVPNGPFGLVGDFNLQADYDPATATGNGEELLATSEAGAVLLANQKDSAEAARSVTQGFTAFGGAGLYAHIQREKLFKNAVWWLLKLAPPPPFLDLALTVEAEPEQAKAGAELKLMASVRHGGELVASGITLAFVLPPGVSYVGSSLSSEDCVFEDGTVICFLGQLSKSETRTVTITVRPDRAGEVTIFGSVSSNQPEAVTENNSSITTLNP